MGGYPPPQFGASYPHVGPVGGNPLPTKQLPPGMAYYQQGDAFGQPAVMAQQGPHMTGIHDYLIANILACFFCCWIIGIFGIIWSAKTRGDISR